MDQGKVTYLNGEPFEGIKTKFGTLWYGIDDGDLVEVLECRTYPEQVGKKHKVINHYRNSLEVGEKGKSIYYVQKVRKVNG